MTGCQRVSRMFERRDHDRVPRHDSYWSETLERWKSEGMCGYVETVLDRLGTDFHGL
jgi:hypothetical protein